MGILNKFFYGGGEEDNEEVKEVQEKESSPQAQPMQAQAATIGAPMSFASAKAPAATPGQITGQFDQKFYDMLSETIEENNLPGNDFLEFMKALMGMAVMSVDEKSKFQMVYTTLTTSQEGITKEHLLSSIDHYLTVLETEKTTFYEQMLGHKTEVVDTVVQQADNCLTQAQGKADQILQLQEEISQLNQQASDLNSQAAVSDSDITQKKANFDVTSQTLYTQIEENKAKVNNYIQ